MLEVKVLDKGMSAEVKVVPEEGEYIDVTYIKETLQLEGVHAGIREDIIKDIVDNRIYGRFVPVAFGKEAVDGVDGYYDFYFVIEEKNKAPKILEDGSVDYTMSITNVQEGEMVAEYHPRTTGTYGYNVFATMLSPKMGKEKPTLRCQGIRIEDNKYYAAKDGLVTLRDNRLLILDVLEINGDVNQNVGNLEFNGDIQVHGSILSNMVVKAKGSIIVDGVIESANVSAEKDILVAKGIHGKGAGKVGAKGNVCATFIDHGHVWAGGDVKVDYSVGSVIEANGTVMAEGNYGSIAGGVITAAGGVEAGTLGNDTEISTRIYAGITNKMREDVKHLKLKLQQLMNDSEKIKNEAEFQHQMELIEEARGKIAELEDMLVAYRSAPIIIHDAIFPGVKCYLSGMASVELTNRQEIELRNIRGRILCRAVGTFSDEEIGLTKVKMKDIPKEKLRILAVDDDPKVLHMINEMLRNKYQVSVARGGASARKFLETKSADLILLDYMMPGENGAEVLKSFRKDEATKDIPVVFLSALEDKKKIMECLALKPAGYVTKPVDSKTLHNKLSVVLAID